MGGNGKRGRPRTVGSNLPRGVHCVRSGKYTYYYYQENRSTCHASERIPLGRDIESPEFWVRLNKLIVANHQPQNTFSDLITGYKASPEWKWLKPATQKHYEYIMRKIGRTIGDMPITMLTKRHVFEMRDALRDTIDTANQLVKMIKFLLDWAIDREYTDTNPAKEVPPLKKEIDTGHKPWPNHAYDYVMERAPEVIRRLVFLGRATGQRLTDLTEMRPSRLERDGINSHISKRRGKRHFIPLLASQMATIQGWAEADGIERDQPFLRSQTNKKLTVRYADRLWAEWRDAQTALQGIELSIHGLKVTAVCDRVGKMTSKEIAVEIGMSERMIQHYTRFIDQETQARASRDRREGKVVQLKRRA